MQRPMQRFLCRVVTSQLACWMTTGFSRVYSWWPEAGIINTVASIKIDSSRCQDSLPAVTTRIARGMVQITGDSPTATNLKWQIVCRHMYHWVFRYCFRIAGGRRGEQTLRVVTIASPTESHTAREQRIMIGFGFTGSGRLAGVDVAQWLVSLGRMHSCHPRMNQSAVTSPDPMEIALTEPVLGRGMRWAWRFVICFTDRNKQIP